MARGVLDYFTVRRSVEEISSKYKFRLSLKTMGACQNKDNKVHKRTKSSSNGSTGSAYSSPSVNVALNLSTKNIRGLNEKKYNSRRRGPNGRTLRRKESIHDVEEKIHKLVLYGRMFLFYFYFLAAECGKTTFFRQFMLAQGLP